MMMVIMIMLTMIMMMVMLMVMVMSARGESRCQGVQEPLCRRSAIITLSRIEDADGDNDHVNDDHDDGADDGDDDDGLIAAPSRRAGNSSHTSAGVGAGVGTCFQFNIHVCM
jgi:hypothetical protein